MNVFTSKLVFDTVVPAVGVRSNIGACNLGIKITPTASYQTRTCQSQLVATLFVTKSIHNDVELLPPDVLWHCQCHRRIRPCTALAHTHRCANAAGTADAWDRTEVIARVHQATKRW